MEPGHLLGLPTAVWVAAFFLAPLGLLTVYSFGAIDTLTLKVSFGWTLANYGRIADGLYLHAIFRSLLLSIGATFACLIIGFPVAYFISRARGSVQTILLVAILVPFWTSFVIRTYALITILQDGGPVARGIQHLGLGSPNILYTQSAIFVGLVYNYLPLMVIPLFVALERIDASLQEAARDLGASGIRTLTRVVIPLALPGIVAGCILVGIPATGEYVIPVLLGGGKTLMFGNVVADQFLNVGDYPFGAALATVFMVVMTAILVASRQWLRPRESAT
jgi:ABC-type spermidine/putrescine transport system permease subunit I